MPFLHPDVSRRLTELRWTIDSLLYHALFRWPAKGLNWLCGSRAWQRPAEWVGLVLIELGALVELADASRDVVDHALTSLFMVLIPFALTAMFALREQVQRELDRAASGAVAIPAGLDTISSFRCTVCLLALLSIALDPTHWAADQVVKYPGIGLVVLSMYSVHTDSPSGGLPQLARGFVDRILPQRGVQLAPA